MVSMSYTPITHGAIVASTTDANRIGRAILVFTDGTKAIVVWNDEPKATAIVATSDLVLNVICDSCDAVTDDWTIWFDRHNREHVNCDACNTDRIDAAQDDVR